MNSIHFYSAASLAPTLATAAKHPGRGPKAAREFEANLIGSLLESLEKSLATLPGESGLPGADDYNYLGTRALAEGLATRGGFGIAGMISRHLPSHEGKGEGVSAGEGSPPETPKAFATPADGMR